MAKQSNWSTAQDNACVKQFNLFRASGGSEGWDPTKTSKKHGDYIVEKLKEVVTTRNYLAHSNGGHKSNSDNAKGLRGYRRVASEFWVSLAKQGIRKSKKRAICSRFRCRPLTLTALSSVLFFSRRSLVKRPSCIWKPIR